MKVIVVAFLIFGAVLAAEETGIEDLDLEKLLGDEAKRKAAFDCLMDRGPCGEMQTLRDTLPSMVETKCANCTPKQKEKFEQSIKILQEKQPKELEILMQKYSPKSD